MNEINPFDQFNNCQMKNSWPKWSPAPQNDNGIQVKREDGNFPYNNNVYSYSPSYQEQTSYFDAERKPQINKNLHPSCGQHRMEQAYYYGAGGNHQVPGSEDSINFETSPNEFYSEMSKHAMPQVIHGADEMYQGTYPNASHPQTQIHPIPMNEVSTSSLPVSLTPYSLPTTTSAPPSPSVAFDLESSQYMSNSSSYQEPIMSPFSAGYQQFSYDDPMNPGTPTRGDKDPKYCERRRKNNEASKKSRAKKKEKAKEMESRAQVLEQENRHLRQKYSELEQEVAVYKKLTETITTCDSQECSTSSCLSLQPRANNTMP